MGQDLAATVLGFSTTLLSASLPIADCKRYILLYAAMLPLAAPLSYTATTPAQVVPTDGPKAPFTLFMKYFIVSPALLLLLSGITPLTSISERPVRLCRTRTKNHDCGQLSNNR